MLRLRRVIQHLQSRARELSQYLYAKRCLLSPIRRLPTELLYMVFALVAIPCPASTPTAAIRLSHVCSLWRTMALETSKLWATIHLRTSWYRKPERRLAQLAFHSSHAKGSPLSVVCKLPSRTLLTKLNRLSVRLYKLTLTIPNEDFEELRVFRDKVPLLNSLCIYNTSGRGGWQTNDAFENAPSLRRIVLAVVDGHIWPFSFILPWEQLTSLTLAPVSLSVFSECLRNCPELLYFNATILARPGEVGAPMAELQSPLRKLVLQGATCQEAVIAHSFPHMVSLSIDMNGLHPDFFAFLARSSHLEMLAIRAWPDVTTADLLALLLATPSLRVVHFRDFH
ncbi:hypothetical protein C8R46DRAFT_302842 [Mycena filopes]|nr:hypothetical protein C8R46DRAFT_302842 [Mycena filopes]